MSLYSVCQGLELFTNGSSPNTLIDMVASHHCFNRKDAMSLLAHGACPSYTSTYSCACAQSLKVSIWNKIDSKGALGALVNHAKISTNENFLLYTVHCFSFWATVKILLHRHFIEGFLGLLETPYQLKIPFSTRSMCILRVGSGTRLASRQLIFIGALLVLLSL
jgi:hypothetical protein